MAGPRPEVTTGLDIPIDNVVFTLGSTARYFPVPHNIHLGYTIDGKRHGTVRRSVDVRSYNGNPADNFRLYRPEQAPTAILPMTGAVSSPPYQFQGSPVAGLTNAQNMAQYGVAACGEVAPTGTTTRSEIRGLLASY